MALDFSTFENKLMSKISKIDAFDIAQKKVQELEKASGDQFEILQNKVICAERGWIFFYNTSEFILTGNPIDSLAGNAPLFVMHSGDILQLSTATPWELVVGNYVDP